MYYQTKQGNMAEERKKRRREERLRLKGKKLEILSFEEGIGWKGVEHLSW